MNSLEWPPCLFGTRRKLTERHFVPILQRGRASPLAGKLLLEAGAFGLSAGFIIHSKSRIKFAAARGSACRPSLRRADTHPLQRAWLCSSSRETASSSSGE